MKKHRILYIIMLLVCSFTMFGCSSEETPSTETPSTPQSTTIDFTDAKVSAKNEINTYINDNLTTFSTTSLIDINSIKKVAFENIESSNNYNDINNQKKLCINKIKLLLTTDKYNSDISEIELEYNILIEQKEELLTQIEEDGYYTESKITWQNEMAEIDSQLQQAYINYEQSVKNNEAIYGKPLPYSIAQSLLNTYNNETNSLLHEKATLETLWENRTEYNSIVNEITALENDMKAEKKDIKTLYDLEILAIETAIETLED